MRKHLITTGLIALVAPLTLSATTGATNIGEEGCTPGYWKNHTDNWLEDADTPIPTIRKLGHIKFVEAGSPFFHDSLLTALSYKGGKGVDGATRILLRAAAAAYLNAAHEGLGYPYRRTNDPVNIVPTVRETIATGDRGAILDLATLLDDANNLGCPLN